MDAEQRRQIEDNLFPSSLPAVEPWDEFPWHLDQAGQPDTYKEHSSQALAIGIFGTIKAAAPTERDTILAAIASELGVPTVGPWTVELEWVDDGNVIRERRRTQVDALARSPLAQIFFECKFTESDGGSCSQKDSLKKGTNKGTVQCNGNYLRQVNPVNQREAMCALSGKGIRYWEVVPQVFHFSADACHHPCPFAGPWFQWMRNLTVAYETGRTSGRKSAFVVSYADAPGLPMADKIHSADWKRLSDVLRPEALPLKAIPMQRIAAIASEAVKAAGLDTAKWRGLSEWVKHRINSVAAAQRPSPRTSPPSAHPSRSAQRRNPG